MPKLVDYPRASFSYSQELADSVDKLGGKCSIQTCADIMGIKVSGSFKALYSAAQKYDLVEHSKGELINTELYKNIKLAYNEEERKYYSIKAFLNPPLFYKLYERFQNKEIPVSILSKILLKEYGMEDEETAQRVGNYFLDGAKQLELINGNNLLKPYQDLEKEKKAVEAKNVIDNINKIFLGEKGNDDFQAESPLTGKIEKSETSGGFIVQITGPHMNLRVNVTDEDDLLLVNTTIKKIEKFLNQKPKENT